MACGFALTHFDTLCKLIRQLNSASAIRERKQLPLLKDGGVLLDEVNVIQVLGCLFE